MEEVYTIYRVEKRPMDDKTEWFFVNSYRSYTNAVTGLQEYHNDGVQGYFVIQKEFSLS